MLRPYHSFTIYRYPARAASTARYSASDHTSDTRAAYRADCDSPRGIPMTIVQDLAASARALPRWDMTPIFPGLTSAEFKGAFLRFVEEVSAARTLCDSLNVR